MVEQQPDNTFLLLLPNPPYYVLRNQVPQATVNRETQAVKEAAELVQAVNHSRDQM